MAEVTPPSLMGARRSATEFCTPEYFSEVAFERPGAGEVGIPQDELESESLSSSVTVAVRVRPFMMRSAFALSKKILFKTVE